MKEDTVTEVTLGHFCHLVKDMCPKCQCTVALSGRWRLHSQWLVRSGPRTMKPTNAVRQDAVSARSRNLSPQAHESLAEAPTICLTSPLLGGLSLSLSYIDEFQLRFRFGPRMGQSHRSVCFCSILSRHLLTTLTTCRSQICGAASEAPARLLLIVRTNEPTSQVEPTCTAPWFRAHTQKKAAQAPVTLGKGRSQRAFG